MTMRIRRDRSNLYFGKRSRHQRRLWLFWVWLLMMAGGIGVVWQLDTIQPQILAVVVGPPTATPNAVSLAQLAQNAYWEGDLDTSILYYAQASELEPENTRIQFEYVRNLIYGSYAGRGFTFRARDALQVAERTVRLMPNDAHAQAAYALALIENGRGDEAAAAALNAIQIAPNWAEPHAYLALAYYTQDRFRSAQEEAQVSVNLDPNSVDARRTLALSMAFTGGYDIAIRQYEAAISIHPRLDALYFELAPYYILLDNYDAAIQSYDRILSHDPRNVKAWTRKCETFFRQREDSLAQEACEQAVELDGTFPEAHKQLGMVRYTRRNYEGAIESFQTCIDLMEAQGWEMSDRLVECYYLHGLAYYTLGDCPKAMPLLQQALIIAPNGRTAEITLQGMEFCVEYDPGNFSSADVPTLVPPTAIPPEPIGIY
ncbi:MAG: tetratricopeptide repeat protein [Anaerolineales bacterium]|nr:tetratricopeptide repeat protein [Anaerolineales bacterium]